MKRLLLGVAAGIGLMFSTSVKSETTECTEITTIPTVITVQGVYCFKKNLSTNATNGTAIDIRAHNVTIDLNDYKLGGSAAGTGTNTNGINAVGWNNITIRNGRIRGFFNGIALTGSPTKETFGHLVEYVRLDGNRQTGLYIEGEGVNLRNNQITNMGDTDNNTKSSGILGNKLKNSTISNNVVSGVSETQYTFGIELISSTNVRVFGNTILDTKDATWNYGVAMNNSSDIIVLENTISNVGGGSTAILNFFGTSSKIGCIDNVIHGYTYGATGCNYVSGNKSF